MKKIDITVFVLMWISALNWGLVGVFDFDLIDALFESDTVDRLVYSLFGLCAVYILVNLKGFKDRWVFNR